MLIRFRVSNFRSLRDEQELSMVAAFREGRTDLTRVEQYDLNLVRVAGIYGANAAGKSNVLAALNFVQEAVMGSHRKWRPDGAIPREPFLLDAESLQRPSLFEVDFLIDGTHVQYGFELNSDRITREWLYGYPNKRRQMWFTRTDQEFTFGKLLKGHNRTIEGLTRKNSLFLSVAAENNHLGLFPVYQWFYRNLVIAKGERHGKEMSNFLAIDEQSRQRIVELLSMADLGVVGIHLKRIPVDSKTKSLALSQLNLSEDEKRFVEDLAYFPQIELQHRSDQDPVSLPLEKESRGTQVWLSLAGPIVHALDNGLVVAIDELDSSLHPRLALEVIRIFQDPARNPHGAQLIFNTHDTSLLGNLFGTPGLARDQVWFAEKDDSGVTHL